MTQLEKAKKGEISAQMRWVAQQEGVPLQRLMKDIAQGWTVIPANRKHSHIKPIGIGRGLTVKINANIGASPSNLSLETELKKLKIAIEAKADTIMDLSIAPDKEDIDRIRRTIIERCSLPLGTVPIYQAVVEAGGAERLNIQTYLKVLRKHAEEGVDFVTVHAGVKRKALELVESRLMPVVSRGGSFLLYWMKKNRKENFLYEYFNEILDIAYEFDMTISLGDGLRPGCIADSTDNAQLYELKVLAELAQRARERGVQVIIEGPGHIPLNEIKKNVELEKEICKGAPFYVLGPLPIDTAVGYDHIACAIGGALAGYWGADFLCYVTPKEHIGLPEIEDVREGVVITKIAAEIADLARGDRRQKERNKQMSLARKSFDWKKMAEYAIDKRGFEQILSSSPRPKEGGCSMCGKEFCALKVYS
ncbi:MAG: phosphomethylpyrimidine synthase [Candidatus Omnitrophota bacterium]|nr:MAG: phosphomethylpyrimidine synthase [Candidatus Omnitrophota bacterium]